MQSETKICQNCQKEFTIKEKIGSWFTDITLSEEKRFVLLYQIRMFSTNRFESRLATIDDSDFKKVKEKLEFLLKLSS